MRHQTKCQSYSVCNGCFTLVLYAHLNTHANFHAKNNALALSCCKVVCEHARFCAKDCEGMLKSLMSALAVMLSPSSCIHTTICRDRCQWQMHFSRVKIQKILNKSQVLQWLCYLCQFLKKNDPCGHGSLRWLTLTARPYNFLWPKFRRRRPKMLFSNLLFAQKFQIYRIQVGDSKAIVNSSHPPPTCRIFIDCSRLMRPAPCSYMLSLGSCVAPSMSACSKTHIYVNLHDLCSSMDGQILGASTPQAIGC